MNKLLAFIVAQRHWLVFVVCEMLSLLLLYHNNVYQRNMILSSAQFVVGNITYASGSLYSYFDLRKSNRILLERAGSMEAEILYLRQQLSDARLQLTTYDNVFLKDSLIAADSVNLNYTFMSASVVNNSTSHLNNYITINRGSADGVRSDMGVISPQGVVGIVMTANSRFSVVIPLLNVKLKVSCKVKNTNYFGALSWKGGDAAFAYLEDMPSHSVFEIGDTIVTSGYSTVFPPGLLVGVVDSYDKQHDDNFYSLKIKLATDFNALDALCVIDNHNQQSQHEIEQEARRYD
ncbi:MAG: rod shape-determining protein MreC [Tannerella sp.]|jgi:rod shape-determining protein MreC|nr:rod shape-determining protein MreC [Tannerella sp.]